MAQTQSQFVDLSSRDGRVPAPEVEKSMNLSSMDGLIRPFNSLSDILLEPSVLSSESALLTSELTNLCHTSYPTFLLLHNTSNTLSTSLSSLSTSLDSLISTIPSLHDATQHFAQTTKPILEERRKASLILDQQDKLIDVLEIPALIDTCARNGQYQDAYELSIHANNLWERYQAWSSPDSQAQQVPIIDALRKEVEASVRMMLSSLIETLKSKAKSPALFKAVGYLRKMGSWSEEDLAVLFLCCRGSYIEGLYTSNAASHGALVSAAVNSNDTARIEGQIPDAARYLRGMIEIYREGVYDTLSAYTTIFLDHNRSTNSTSDTPESTSLLEDLRHLLSIFTHQHTKLLINVLHTHLHTVTDFTSLSSLLTQLNYCAAWFARVGLDFRALLQPPFEVAVVRNIKILMEDASRAFVEEVVGNDQARVLPSKWLVTAPPTSAGTPITPTTPATSGATVRLPDIPDSLDSKPNQATSTSTAAPTSISQPPQILAFSPPLATLLNAYMSTLNSLRLLPIISALPKMYTQMCTSLAKCLKALLDYSRLITSPASPTTRVSFERRGSRSSISLERGASLPSIIGGAVGSGRPGTPTTGTTTPRPTSPTVHVQRAATPTSARPRTPRQSFTSDETRSQPRQETERDIMLAAGKAYVRILVPFIRRALVTGVYGIEMETFIEGIPKRDESDEVQALAELESLLEEWEKWYEEWKPKAQEINGASSQK